VAEDSNEAAQKARRSTLAAFVRQHFGSINAFAIALDRKQPQLNETLNGARSFGEKLARSLEEEVDKLRTRAEFKKIPALRFDSSGDTHPRLAMLIRHFEAIETEEKQDLLIQIAGTMANKSGEEAASTQVERDVPVRGLSDLQPGSKAAPKKRRRA